MKDEHKPQSAGRPRGRPSKYTKEIAEEICGWLADGKSMRSYCREPGNVPLSTVTRWIVSNEDFRERYIKARESAGHAHADEILGVIDELRSDLLDAAAARVIIDALKWSSERMAPKAYGPRQNHDVEGGLSVTITTGVPDAED